MKHNFYSYFVSFELTMVSIQSIITPNFDYYGLSKSYKAKLIFHNYKHTILKADFFLFSFYEKIRYINLQSIITYIF